MRQFIEQLKRIVGEAFVSDAAEERFIYSRDQGTMPPSDPDVVAMPADAAQIQAIVRLAGQHKVPVVPMGGGLVLSGLTRPLKGGLVLDLKRMNRVLEVNALCRYAVVEAGCSEGMLQAYLKKHHPDLKHSMPDAPPIATVGGNMLIHGSGHMSAWAGYHTDQLGGLEVVLPDGELARLGTCAVSPEWFGRAPLPDLAGLFLGWAGATGVVTKLAIKLFPRRPFNDVRIFVCEDAELGAQVINKLTGVGVIEDMTAWMTPVPAWANGLINFNAVYSANSKEELTWKRELLSAAVGDLIKQRVGGFMMLPPPMKKNFMEEPASNLAKFADVKKGGGFEYVGAIMPIDRFAQAYRTGLEVAERHDVAYSLGCRVIGQGHAMMFFYAYAFNRADQADIARAQAALEETNLAALDMGGIPWKAEAPAQKQIMARMDPGALALMGRVRAMLDPAGIMNPGNWEAM
ncbi:FAD linked oxidase domain protein [Desulfarculus baarsii DSM 2075]|uniref:FAD linked oxidase domain protein n=1 Tax=Desulfarculus baarsii (strain ATCC 33931 / DSM 2075 / LMG 7858 / VKM B-1802 / 2st14) TaxID=644282 RepID=E1QGP6_DESB2|nr:FAD-binding oxidoreductase [Desulfarculus baarsii]ADK84739.1 FAD linked oxidase domain protein [Desulfarculus baarsii DSM 2075]